MIPMYKVVLLAGPALISTYSGHPSRITDPLGGVVAALKLDLMDLLRVPDTVCVPWVVFRDMMEALKQGVNAPTRHEVVIGMTSHASRHPMYKGGVAPISVRVVRC